MKIKVNISNLFFGVLGGLLMAILTILRIYYEVSSWFFFLLATAVVVLPMALHRIKNKKDTTFSGLFKVGFIVMLINTVVTKLAHHLYTNLFLSQDQKKNLFDEKISRLILANEDTDMNIFSEDDLVRSLLDPYIVESFFYAIIGTIPLMILMIIIFSLILKPNVVMQEEDLSNIDVGVN